MIAEPGSVVEDISVRFDAVAAGVDQFVTPSPDGRFYVVQGGRFGCLSGGCLARFDANGAHGELVLSGGRPIDTSNTRAAIASSGDRIVYATSGPHVSDLYVVDRDPQSGAWGAPRLLTGSSPYPFHHTPSIARDGSKVVFNCGPNFYGVAPLAICEATLDPADSTSAYRKLLDPSAGGDHSGNNELYHPAYELDGSIVFESDWTSEQIWHLGGTDFARVSPASVTDDNSPCVLPDGRIVSLWLGRAGNPNGLHEIKVMNADGSGGVMLLTGVDVDDVGTSCSE
jgi:hypothetical protein